MALVDNIHDIDVKERPVATAPRGMLTSSRLVRMDDRLRKGKRGNEEAAENPKALSAHGPGCAYRGGGAKESRRTWRRLDGSKSYQGARPCMISH
ncbi:MAG: hypothetical protein AAF360_16525 [Pseudomonadota bacterium]